MLEITEKYANPQYYHNRELSWLQFDRRCLSEARNKDNPLFERLKFLGITASNLDEFFMVRVASLQDMQNAGYKKRDIAGMTAGEQLAAILYRSAQGRGLGCTGTWSFPLAFEDADQVSECAYEAMCWMNMNGVINGMSDKVLSPKSDASRAQAAAMLMRFSEKVS